MKKIDPSDKGASIYFYIRLYSYGNDGVALLVSIGAEIVEGDDGIERDWLRMIMSWSFVSHIESRACLEGLISNILEIL